MPKASFKLPNGTLISVEGSEEEVIRLLHLYGSAESDSRASRRKRPNRQATRPVPQASRSVDRASIDLAEIVNQVKTCAEAEKIELQILDATSQVNRVLLPLYIVNEYFDETKGLTTGDISKITKELGIPISTANVSHTLSGSANRYVMTDGVRKRGQPTKYRLIRRGQQYMKSVLAGKSDV